MGEPLTRYRTVHVCRGGYTLGWLASAVAGALIMWLNPWWLVFVLGVVIYAAGLKFTHRNCHTEPTNACGHEAAGLGGYLRCVLDAGHRGWHRSARGSEWREGS